jgi:hypothetical protein
MVLAFGLPVKHQFVTKTNRNSVFLSHEVQILDRLYIMVMYINFYGFYQKKARL